ncbi:enoyl-CoA hydratase/isomerase family protein [Gordonia neofelifaecis]|uniref:Enoyl-CoA hydratase/isomerase n=1 Tax=Gordonia neofelifaecis NRRL B-59395 TaxID=644548 RepID=F1YK32_9ACTN|nr:enoyl-CoA hydratase-related protein [Gordonia neofelifaecis]EGD54878.1 enoyl-CoA hydratase/isomerase [Gordonia neofelifaecis NRRL B-59395]
MTGTDAAGDQTAPEVLFEKRDHIAYITLNRPHKGNSLTGAMMPMMKDVWGEVRDDPDIRAAIVTGAGEKHFCTGADVDAVALRGGMSTGTGPLTDEVYWSPHQNRVWKPVISAVNGLVAGAGLHFVVDADIVVAADHAAFMDTHVNVGLVGAMENIGLAKRLPLGTALRMTLMGRDYRLPAERAYQLGLVDELVAPGELMETAEQIARSIAANSPAAVSLSKQAVWNSLEAGYSQACEYGWSLLRMHWAHPDSKEGPRAFSERREPQWTTVARPEK